MAGMRFRPGGEEDNQEQGGLHPQLQRGLLNRPLLVLSWPAEELLAIEEEGVDKTLEEEEEQTSIKIVKFSNKFQT